MLHVIFEIELFNRGTLTRLQALAPATDLKSGLDASGGNDAERDQRM